MRESNLLKYFTSITGYSVKKIFHYVEMISSVPQYESLVEFTLADNVLI